MGCGRGGGPDETSGGDTPTGRGGRGSGGTPERGAVMGARGGIPGEQVHGRDDFRHMNRICHTNSTEKYYRLFSSADLDIKKSYS